MVISCGLVEGQRLWLLSAEGCEEEGVFFNTSGLLPGKALEGILSKLILIDGEERFEG